MAQWHSEGAVSREVVSGCPWPTQEILPNLDQLPHTFGLRTHGRLTSSELATSWASCRDILSQLLLLLLLLLLLASAAMERCWLVADRGCGGKKGPPVLTQEMRAKAQHATALFRGRGWANVRYLLSWPPRYGTGRDGTWLVGHGGRFHVQAVDKSGVVRRGWAIMQE